MIELSDRLYTSTEVAEILGVSLRSVYRYLEEDKLHAEVKTATGRHRFTKKNILDFLYPEGTPQSSTTSQPTSDALAQAGTSEDVSKITVTGETDDVSAVGGEQVTVSTQPTDQGVQTDQILTEQVEQPAVATEDIGTEPAIQTEVTVEEQVTEPLEDDEEPIDWLSKFREAAKKFKEEEAAVASQQTSSEEPAVQAAAQTSAQSAPSTSATAATAAEPSQVQEKIEVKEEVTYSAEPAFGQTAQKEAAPQPAPAETVSGIATEPVKPEPAPAPEPAPEPKPESNLYFYKSDLGGLKDIAQNVDKSARNSNVDYAFTMNAGLSLYKPIKPFSVLHVYTRPADREFFEKALRLKPASQEDAQLCLILSGSSSVYDQRTEVHGLYVVSKGQMLKDIQMFNDSDLENEAQGILS